jgi:hypothetical protein
MPLAPALDKLTLVTATKTKQIKMGFKIKIKPKARKP